MFEYNNKLLFYIYRKLLTFCDKMNGRQSKVGCMPFYVLGIMLKIIFCARDGSVGTNSRKSPKSSRIFILKKWDCARRDWHISVSVKIVSNVESVDTQGIEGHSSPFFLT